MFRRLAWLLLIMSCDYPAVDRSQPPGDLLCIGDSIRQQGWAKYLKCEQPPDNCGDTRNGLRSIDRWTGGRHWNVIVLNFGLHDIHHNVPLDEYAANLRQIVARLDADYVYFCLTTPGRDNNWLGRTPANVAAYNSAARWVMSQEHIPLIDLHGEAMAHREWWLPNVEDVHYTQDGYSGMARYIARAIGRSTTINATPCQEPPSQR